MGKKTKIQSYQDLDKNFLITGSVTSCALLSANSNLKITFCGCLRYTYIKIDGMKRQKQAYRVEQETYADLVVCTRNFFYNSYFKEGF